MTDRFTSTTEPPNLAAVMVLKYVIDGNDFVFLDCGVVLKGALSSCTHSTQVRQLQSMMCTHVSKQVSQAASSESRPMCYQLQT